MSEDNESVPYNIPVSELMYSLWERLPDGAYIGGQVADILEPKVEVLTEKESQEMLDRYQWEYILSRFIESEFSIVKLRIRVTRNPENGNYTITHQGTGQKCPMYFHFSEKELAENVDHSRDEMNAYLPKEDLEKLLIIIENSLGTSAPKNIDDAIRDILKKERMKGLQMEVRLPYKKSNTSISGKIAESLFHAANQIHQKKFK